MANTARPATTRSYTIPEAAAAAVIAFIAVAALTVWAAGQLSSLVAGHGTIKESPASGLGVLLRLPEYWRTPAQAWPAPADRQVSGPIGFYAILVGILSAAIAAARAGVPPLLLRHRARSWAFGVEPHAGLAKPSDLKALHIERRIPGRLTLGTVAGQLIAAEADTSLAVIGPTGCGKTIGFAIPAMLEWAEGPVLCTSVKTDLLQASLQRRRELGKVWIFDPTGSTSQPTAHWNPLQGCETFAGATQTAAWLTAALPTRRASLEDADHWENQARKALPALLMAAANQQLTMAHVARWIDLQEEQTIRETLLQAAGIDNKIVEILAPQTTQDATEEQLAQVHQQAVDELLAAGQLDALAAISALWDLDPRIQGSVYSTLQNIALVYTDPAVAAATTPPADTDLAVDFNEWLTGPNTIYLIAPSFASRSSTAG